MAITASITELIAQLTAARQESIDHRPAGVDFDHKRMGVWLANDCREIEDKLRAAGVDPDAIPYPQAAPRPTHTFTEHGDMVMHLRDVSMVKLSYSTWIKSVTDVHNGKVFTAQVKVVMKDTRWGSVFDYYTRINGSEWYQRHVNAGNKREMHFILPK